MAHLKRTQAAHRSRSGDIFIPRVYVFIYPLAVRGNADFIVALRKLCPQRIPNQIIYLRLGFLLIRPVIQLRDLSLDLLQQRGGYLLELFDFLL